MDKAKLVERLTAPQRRVLLNLTPEPQSARKSGSWSPVAAFNLVRWQLVKLHQSYTGDRYSLTADGAAIAAALRSHAQPK